jgi:hypothetical protein
MWPTPQTLHDVHGDAETPPRRLYKHASMHFKDNEQRFTLVCAKKLWSKHSRRDTSLKIALMWAG